METAEHTLKDALRGSVERNKTQVALTEESRLLLASLLRDEMATAVAEGIKKAMSNDAARDFAKIFMSEVQVQATTRIDNWSGGLVRAAIKKVLFFGFMGSIVYGVGGWTALAALGKWMVTTAGLGK